MVESDNDHIASGRRRAVWVAVALGVVAISLYVGTLIYHMVL